MSSQNLSFNFSSDFLVAKSSERNDANLFLKSHLNSCFQYYDKIDKKYVFSETRSLICPARVL